MTRASLARELGTARETVWAWENLRADGDPRQRTTRRSAAAIAKLAQERLGWSVTEAAFFGLGESAASMMLATQHQMANQLDQILTALSRIEARIADARGWAGERG